MERNSLILALLLIVFARPSPAPGGAPTPVHQLVNQASTIAVGSIVDGMQSGTTVNASIQVEHTLRGSAKPGTRIVAKTAVSESAVRPIDKVRGLFFLNEQGGFYSIVPISTGYLPDFSATFFQLGSTTPDRDPPLDGATLLDAVILELRSAPAAGLRGRNVDDEVIEAYRASPSAAWRAMFAHDLAGDSAPKRAVAMNALLTEGSLDALAALELQPRNIPPAGRMTGTYFLQHYFLYSDPRATAILGRMVTNKGNSKELREAAGFALAKLHDENKPCRILHSCLTMTIFNSEHTASVDWQGSQTTS